MNDREKIIREINELPEFNGKTAPRGAKIISRYTLYCLLTPKNAPYPFGLIHGVVCI